MHAITCKLILHILLKHVINSLSLSTISTTAVKSSPSTVPNGNDTSTIVILNDSSSSASVSSCIEILKEEQLVPAGNVTMYCVVSNSP